MGETGGRPVFQEGGAGGLLELNLGKSDVDLWQLDIVASEKLGGIVADHQRLKQILIKLLANAANFAAEGTAIELKCWRDGEDFVFSVSDNGPGIPQDVLRTVFNRFESHGRRGGAGLGLSIVESFVSLHHGTVTIDSREGEGTCVTCRIPPGSLHSFAQKWTLADVTIRIF